MTPARCPECGSDDRAVQRMYDPADYPLPSAVCNDAWHRCPTCGSTDPKVRRGRCVGPSSLTDAFHGGSRSNTNE